MSGFTAALIASAPGFAMGVGGTFDVAIGKVKRAPVWMQKSGLEWFYRFLQEPRRMWKRYLVTNTTFIVLVAREWIRGLFGARPGDGRGVG